MSFEKNIQEWVQLDNQLKNLNENIKEIRKKRDELENNLTSMALNNNKFNDTINISNGKIKFIKNKIPEALTFRYLEKTLKEIIKNDEQCNKIIEYIKNNRNVKIIPEIKRLYIN